MISTLSDALAERGYDTLTEVQEAVTAPELAEADLLVSAQTGSGKTVGFGLAIAPTLLGEDTPLGLAGAPLALVVAPTRELALQVQRELAWLYAKADARVISCIGGMDARNERRALERGAHIVVGTPGRLRDHITRGSLDLSDIRAIVLDEADEMLDLGFREDLEFMLGEAPETRRTLLFSATVPPAIEHLAKTYQRDAIRVTTISRGSQHADITYQAIQVSDSSAENAIINLLRFHDAPRSIVFANTRAAVARLTARLSNRGLAVVSLSGELSQDERSHALQAMRDGRARVCVATDVAARGIDLPNLDLVIHADLPTNTEALLHRSGRTGRAGRKGISALIVADKASKKASRLLKWAKIQAEWTFAPSAEEILALDETRLLADEVWAAEPGEDEVDFVARLLAEQSPEKIAVACLRLYRAGLSAPEDLTAPPPREPRAERAPFGPSVWVELSVGAQQRAEARWLLPLLCRAGNLDKSHIGKIRVQDDKTHVELAEPALAGFLDALGADGLLEDDIRAKALDGVPEDTRPSGPRGKPRQDRGDRPARGPRPDRGERPERGPRPDHGDRPARGPKPDRAPRERREFTDRDDRPAKSFPRKDTTPEAAGTGKPYRSEGKPAAGAGKPFAAKDKPRRDNRDEAPRTDRKPRKFEGSGKPERSEWKKPAEGGSGKPYGSKDKPRKPAGSDKPFRSGDKPGGGKPFGAKDKPRGPRPEGKPDKGFKPRGAAPAGDKPAKPAGKARPDASDTSKRFERPGAKPRRPAGKPTMRGGDSPPRRKG